MTDSKSAGLRENVAVSKQAGPPDKRSRLIAAARTVLHEQGIERTTIADIASTAQVPLGNVYYYFRSKDALIAAVVDAYDADYVMVEQVLAGHRTPKSRLKALVRLLTSAGDRIALYGCPIGTLCSELDKRDDDVRLAAATVMERLITIAEHEFRQIRPREARTLAVALIASYEGAALLANTLRDPVLLTTEARRLERWIDSLKSAS